MHIQRNVTLSQRITVSPVSISIDSCDASGSGFGSICFLLEMRVLLNLFEGKWFLCFGYVSA